MITEDIAVSWKLHLRGYRIKYEPLAMCWMLVPETLGGLWKQRVRWKGTRSITTRLFLLSSFTMTFINVIQFTVALFIDSRYEKKNMAGLIFVSWYPTVYWIINAAVVLVAFPKALKRKKGYATWSSPDRGNTQR